MTSFGVFPSTKPPIKSATSLPAASPRSPHQLSPKFPPSASARSSSTVTTRKPTSADGSDPLIKSLHQQIYLLELETRFLRSNKSLAEKETSQDVSAIRRTFTDQIALKDARIAELEAKLKDAHAHHARVEGKLNELGQEHEASVRAHARALADAEANLASKGAEVTRLTTALARARQVGDHAQTHLVHAQSEIASAQADLQATRAELDTFRAKCESQAAQLADLQSKLDLATQSNTLLDQVSQLQAQLRAADSATAQAQATARHLQVTLAGEQEARTRVDAELQRALQECAGLTLKLGTAESELARVQRMIDAGKDEGVSKHEALGKRVRELEAQVDALQAAALVRQKELTKLRDELTTRDRLIVQLREESAAEAERAGAESALAASLRADMTEAAKEVAELRAKIGVVENRLAVAEKERENGWNEVDKVRAEVREWTRKAKVWARAEEVVKGVPLEGLAELRRALEDSENKSASGHNDGTGRAGV
ncbi:hypothetical protein BCR44DRAFT_325688 [Catenaria anguillulae PL171]|uniref:Uncharacterized protein n=1 Tax=Catenaria anguillulae PL171 TaxID=765915 RepID=A0A1Y2HFU0_9FUNG|nr:hypothetical protein BCR44DRAFT_325688 [Catenaria anguillulae PL171]